MDTPKPVIPVQNFAYQPLGLESLIKSQNFFAQTGSVMPTNNTLATSRPADVAPDYYAWRAQQSGQADTGAEVTPYTEARRYDDITKGFRSDRDNEDLYAQDQGVLGSMGSGIGRLVGTTFTKLGAGLSYVASAAAFGLAAPFTDSVNNFQDWMTRSSDNILVNMFNSMEDKIKEAHLGGGEKRIEKRSQEICKGE